LAHFDKKYVVSVYPYTFSRHGVILTVVKEEILDFRRYIPAALKNLRG